MPQMFEFKNCAQSWIGHTKEAQKPIKIIEDSEGFLELSRLSGGCYVKRLHGLIDKLAQHPKKQ